MKKAASIFKNDDVLNLEATELKLGLPGGDESDDRQQSSSPVKNNKRSSPEMDESSRKATPQRENGAPCPKERVVGWPPVRAYRRNVAQQNGNESDTGCGTTTSSVKVSMDGAPYMRKIDLKLYSNYFDLLKALENMFKCTTGKEEGSEYRATYEDKEGDWMLVGDVPWEMFTASCRRMRIMKGVA